MLIAPLLTSLAALSLCRARLETYVATVNSITVCTKCGAVTKDDPEGIESSS